MPFSINLTKRVRRRRLRSGGYTLNERYVLNYRDPKHGNRVQLFFPRQKDAIAKRNDIILQVETRTYVPARDQITVAEAVQLWLDQRRGEVKERTLEGYQQASRYIVGPLVRGTPRQRPAHAEGGEANPPTEFVKLPGQKKVNELTAAKIRAWKKTLTTEVGAFSAGRARQYLQTALALAAEDLKI